VSEAHSTEKRTHWKTDSVVLCQWQCMFTLVFCKWFQRFHMLF